MVIAWMILLVVAFAMLVAILRFFRRRAQRLASAEPLRQDHCVCGYALKGLDTLRCPECGRVIGFEATAEDLGLTEEQLRRAHAKRRERESSTS